MTDEEISSLWQRAPTSVAPGQSEVNWFARAVAAAEREACAKVADEQVSEPRYSEYELACTMTAESIAASIRKRSNV